MGTHRDTLLVILMKKRSDSMTPTQFKIKKLRHSVTNLNLNKLKQSLLLKEFLPVQQLYLNKQSCLVLNKTVIHLRVYPFVSSLHCVLLCSCSPLLKVPTAGAGEQASPGSNKR